MIEKMDGVKFGDYDVILASIYDQEQDNYSIPLTLYEACNLLANHEVDVDDLKKLDIYVIGVMDVKTGELKSDIVKKYLFMRGEDFVAKRVEIVEVKKDEI